jgi:hypothetical protein
MPLPTQSKYSRVKTLMYVLNHNDVDNYPSVWAKWNDEPTKEQLVKFLKNYYTEEKSNEIADELIQLGSCSVGDRSCTTFEVQSI